MTKIRFEVPGVPVAKGRPRASRTALGVRMHTPAKTVRYESLVALFASRAMAGRPPIDVAIILEVAACLPIPASWSKKKTTQALEIAILPIGKPDYDNIAKIVGDACNGIIWTDDSRIVQATIHKYYGAIPCLIVTAWVVDGEVE